jgi:hypothetical protein
MRWTTLNFGKHAGESLPQIILSDADWFFWAVDRGVFKGKLAEEAEYLMARAKAIKIPKRRHRRWQVEYRHEDNGSFCGFSFVQADGPFYGGSPRIYRLPYLDLSSIRRKAYDKGGCKRFLRDFRYAYFGDGKRLTKRR